MKYWFEHRRDATAASVQCTLYASLVTTARAHSTMYVRMCIRAYVHRTPESTPVVY